MKYSWHIATLGTMGDQQTCLVNEDLYKHPYKTPIHKLLVSAYNAYFEDVFCKKLWYYLITLWAMLSALHTIVHILQVFNQKWLNFLDAQSYKRNLTLIFCLQNKNPLHYICKKEQYRSRRSHWPELAKHLVFYWNPERRIMALAHTY